MDPVKRDGKIREQIEIEHNIRRKYPQKWGRILQDQRVAYYNPNLLNEEIHKITSESCQIWKFLISEKSNLILGNYPYESTGHGDSYFMSKEMYEALMSKCRCGRPRHNGHVLKCLQKAIVDNEQEHISIDKESSKQFPKTTLRMYGWVKNRYVDLEQSTKYISPRYDMPGGKIDDKPYHTLFFK